MLKDRTKWVWLNPVIIQISKDTFTITHHYSVTKEKQHFIASSWDADIYIVPVVLTSCLNTILPMEWRIRWNALLSMNTWLLINGLKKWWVTAHFILLQYIDLRYKSKAYPKVSLVFNRLSDGLKFIPCLYMYFDETIHLHITYFNLRCSLSVRQQVIQHFRGIRKTS